MKPVKIMKKKNKKITLSKKKILILNRSLLKKMTEKITINNMFIFIIIFPAIKLNGNKANKKLIKLALVRFIFENKYIF